MTKEELKIKIKKIYENKKCKNCNDGCVGCDYFYNKIIPKILENKKSLTEAVMEIEFKAHR